MGTIAQKLTYLDGTKQALKESINNLGGDITSETTFREYAQELQDIYDNLPKTTDEGSNLSLNTIKGKMNIISKGDTKQDTTTGKNLFVLRESNTIQGVTYTKNSDGTFDLVGTASGTANFYIDIEETLQENTQYTLSLDKTYSPTFTIRVAYINSGAWGGSYGSLVSSSTSSTFLTGTGLTTNQTRYQITVDSGSTYNFKNIKVQLEKNSSATSWEPYTNGASPNPTYPQNIEVVTGTQEVKVENVNLYADIQTQTLNGMTITKTDNGYILNGTTTANTTFRGTITNATNTNKTICAKCDTAITNANIQIKTRSSTQAQLRSISLGNANTWVVDSGTYEDYYCDIYVKSGVTLNNALVQPMLLNGTYTSSNIPTYTPHQEQTQIVSLGDIELCKIGNYQDYLYKSNDKWYKKEYIGKYTFTGSETYTTWTNNRVVISNTPNNYLKVANSSIPLVKCTHYTPVTRDNILSSNKSITFYSSSDSAMGTIVNDSDHNTNTLLKEFMTNNDVEIIYVLSTPNDIEITNETLIEQLENLEKLKSYNGTTNINCSGNLPFILSVSALKGE